MKDYTDIDKMKSFIPQKVYNFYSADKDSRYHLLIDDKILFHDFLSYYGLPVPTRFFIFRNGQFRNGTELLTDNDVDRIISSITDDRIFVKRFTGSVALGILIFKKIENGIYSDSDGEKVCGSLIRRKFQGQDYIFEKQIVQESVLSKFNPDTSTLFVYLHIRVE